MAKIKVFLDTDVIISSLLSQKGASFEIINNKKIKKIISKILKSEVEEVVKRLSIKKSPWLKNIETVSLNLSKKKLLKDYSAYVFDQKDSHVIAGAKLSNSRFLLTHNTKHYNILRIKNGLEIVVMKPGVFLQYLRSKK